MLFLVFWVGSTIVKCEKLLLKDNKPIFDNSNTSNLNSIIIKKSLFE